MLFEMEDDDVIEYVIDEAELAAASAALTLPVRYLLPQLSLIKKKNPPTLTTLKTPLHTFSIQTD